VAIAGYPVVVGFDGAPTCFDAVGDYLIDRVDDPIDCSIHFPTSSCDGAVTAMVAVGTAMIALSPRDGAATTPR
jgi:hypothetical protein